MTSSVLPEMLAFFEQIKHLDKLKQSIEAHPRVSSHLPSAFLGQKDERVLVWEEMVSSVERVFVSLFVCGLFSEITTLPFNMTLIKPFPLHRLCH